MLKTILRRTFLFAIALGILSCSPKTDYLRQADGPKVARKSNGTKVLNPRVDILFVIDDSGSMDSHQQTLANNIKQFVDTIYRNKIIDYHIGVITSSVGMSGAMGTDGKLVGSPRYVERGTSNFTEVLQKNMKVGINGSGWEKFFEPIRMALTPPNVGGWNKGFYRPDGTLAILFITDAEDQSTSAGPDDTAKFLLKLKGGDKSKILAYGAIVPSKDTTNCSRDDSSARPERIEKFINFFGSKPYSLCDPQYGKKLGAIADDLVLKVGRAVYLDRIPDVNSIRVSYGTQEIPNDYANGWTYDPTQNAIYLGDNIKWSKQGKDTVVEVFFVPADENLDPQYNPYQ